MYTWTHTSTYSDSHNRIIVFSAYFFMVSSLHSTLLTNKVLQPRKQTDMLQGTLLLLSLHRAFPDTLAGIAPHSPSGPPNQTHSHTHKHTHRHTHTHTHALSNNSRLLELPGPLSHASLVFSPTHRRLCLPPDTLCLRPYVTRAVHQIHRHKRTHPKIRARTARKL